MNMKALRIVLAFTLIVIFGVNTKAQNSGDLDLNFNGSGHLFIDVNGGDELATNVLVQPDGKIIVTGTSTTPTSYDFVVTRRNPDGSPDNTFSYDGVATTLISATGVVSFGSALQPDGKIVVVGYGSFITGTNGIVLRYNVDGSLDNTFGTNGKAELSFAPNSLALLSVAIQSDGKIVCSGMYHNGTHGDMMVLRLNTDGSFDSSFSSDGLAYFDINATNEAFYDLAIQDDGKIVAVGTTENTASEKEFVVARLNTDGTLDNSFSTNGYTEIDFAGLDNDARAITLSGDKILVAGYCNTGSHVVMAVGRLNSDGTMDHSFGTMGEMLIPFYSGTVAEAQSICVQQDGRVLVAGSADNGVFKEFGVARLNDDGSLDNSFGSGGKVQTDLSDYDVAYSVAMQNDGKILMAGRATTTNLNFAIVRYISGVNIGIGEVATTIGSTFVYPNPIINNEVRVEFELSHSQDVSIQLFDLTGKLITTLRPETKMIAGQHSQSFTLPNLSTGQYLLRLMTEKGNVGVKLMVD